MVVILQVLGWFSRDLLPSQLVTQIILVSHTIQFPCLQVTRFAAPLAFNFLHVVRMHQGLPNGLVSLPTHDAGFASFGLCRVLAVFRSET